MGRSLSTAPQAPRRAADFPDCLAADQARLRQLARESRHAFGEKKAALVAEAEALLASSRAAVAARVARLPKPDFPEDLPVNGRRDEIAALIAAHQVVIVCGETGSGKTTQLPKICLALGRGTRGLIGHTQPRRIAARAVASRLGQELACEPGTLVGYKIRFTDRTSPNAFVKLMTDGILLAETQGDPLLAKYDTLIIDEAHERSLNIDFLLGYLRQLLPKRPDLKVVITSATIDAERFARHFALAGRPAPVIEVSGRLYPVELRYRPLHELPLLAEDEEAGDDVGEATGEEAATSASSMAPTPRPPARDVAARARANAAPERDLYDAIVDACDELLRHGPGDILVFLPGEREIRDAAEALRKHTFRGAGAHAEILPLFARLSAEEQSRIFRPHGGLRIVLATNVAETSLTVPGIRYVVDSGLARVKRYSYRNKVEQLRVEKIAQAAANQRAGRCGRVAAGVCIRLYDEADFAARPAFGDPEILRSSLAGVILRMKLLRLGDIEDFPFIDAPPGKAISDGYQLLTELGAVNDARSLTEIGRILAALPLDPRIARMIVAARAEGCLEEMLVIAAALTVQDPRDRPQERLGSADAAHARFADDKSEFLSWLKLWRWYEGELAHKKSQRKLAQACQENFLSPQRMREWFDVHGQLHALAAEHGWLARPGEGRAEAKKGAPRRGERAPASEAPAAFVSSLPERAPLTPGAEAARYAMLHRALLSGLLGNIGCRSEEAAHYLGARGIRFFVHPGSPLQKKAGKWIAAAEIAETSRLYARCVARIDPDWLEQVGAHLIKRSHSEPHWEKKAMQAVAYERTTLYGLVVTPRRRVALAPLDPAMARELFIREGLVGGEVSEEYARRWGFYRHNRALIDEIEALEHKSRRPDVLVDDELIHAFYDRVIPAEVFDAVSFEQWRREAEREQPKLLHLERDELMRHEAAGVTSDAFPPRLSFGSGAAAWSLPLSYQFEPGSARDGVTLSLPLAQLNRLPATRCEWLVPGLLREKVLQLVKTLPQRIRAKLMPLPEFADAFVAAVTPSDEPLLAALIAYIHETRGLNARGWALTPDSFRVDALPAHLFMNFRLVESLDESPAAYKACGGPREGRLLAMSRHLAELRAEWGKEARAEFAAAAAASLARRVEAPEPVAALQKKSKWSGKGAAPVKDEAPPAAPLAGAAAAPSYSGLTSWTFGELPEIMEVAAGGQSAIGYPALKDDGDSVSLRVFDSPEEAKRVHRQGLLRLFMLNFREQVKYLEKNLPNLTQMGMLYLSLGSADELRRQLIETSFARACLGEPWPNDADAFAARCADARQRIGLLAQEICRLVERILVDWQALTKKLPGFRTHAAVLADIERQIGRLIGKRFVVDTPFERLQHFQRYLQAAALRLDKLRKNGAEGIARDTRAQAEVAALWAQYERRAQNLARQGVADAQLEQFRWLIEELRVQLFAQELRTPAPVSVKRLQKMLEGI
ncbi:ATP-dependent helicase [Rhodocyclus purpureus]|nr:ATP-dependent helicase [Rhodocyclus purpureus]